MALAPPLQDPSSSTYRGVIQEGYYCDLRDNLTNTTTIVVYEYILALPHQTCEYVLTRPTWVYLSRYHSCYDHNIARGWPILMTPSE